MKWSLIQRNKSNCRPSQPADNLLNRERLLQETYEDALAIMQMAETPGWQVVARWLDEKIDEVHIKLMEDSTDTDAVNKARGALEVLICLRGQVDSYHKAKQEVEAELRSLREEEK